MKKPLLISLICLVASGALLIWGFQSPATSAAPQLTQVALLIENDTGSFLMQLRKGMQEAANDGNILITVEKALADPQAQAAELAERGISAALLLLENPRPLLTALGQVQLPAILIGQTIRGQVCVTGEDAACGEALAQRALALAEPAKVLWLTDEASARGRERAAGAQALLRRHGVTSLPWPQEAQVLAQYDAVVGCTQAVTQGLSALKADGSLESQVAVLGMDTGEGRVADLEEGRVQAMAMDSPYAMGYVAVGLVPKLAAGEGAPSVHTCPMPLVDLSNMYLAENVKAVFPLLQ